jgi:ferritin-like metal-binding protein YciE
MAGKLGLSEAEELLNETLSQEEEADQKLTEVAESLYKEVLTGDAENQEEDQEEVAVANSRNGRARRAK